MKNFKLLLILMLLSVVVFAADQNYIPKTVIIKVKEGYRSSCDQNGIRIQSVQEIFNAIEIATIIKKFPNAKHPGALRSTEGHRLIDLSLIYEITYNKNLPLEKVIKMLNITGVFEYSEPHYLPDLLYTPNDPGATRSIQYYLTNIRAYEAWDVSKGDTNMVVGITDTGTDLTHPELFSSIKKNYLDPIDGIDNDLDGYTDNFYGWDLGDNDNNPTWAALAHGVHVSGLSSAVANNATGMAGTGFNCKYLPVKISNSNGSLTAAYEGIVYAADHGCKVINCSWGGTGGGQFGQDVVNYAVFNKDALVISASGNDNKFVNFFPASYKHVLCVAATDSLDRKSTFSNYSCFVDVSAPGADIYSTWPNGYLYSNGTSMAAPIVAGAAALLRSHITSYTALQSLEQLKVSTDPIYHINAFYTDYLGTGRLNMFKSLTISGTPGIDLEDHEETNNGTNIFASGDTIRIKTFLKNYLAPSQNLTLTLRSSSAFINIIDSVYSMSSLTTFELDSNSTDPFDAVILPSAPTNGNVRFKLLIDDGTYSTSFCFDITVNVDYINVTINDIATSITSRGKIGFNSDNRMNGLGFIYNDQADLLYEAGLMVGNSSSTVSDAVRGLPQQQSERDFVSIQNVREQIPSVVSEFDLIGLMNDDSAGISKLGVEIKQNTYVWSTPGNTKYIMIKYTLKNPTNLPLLNVHAGIFADWDIQSASQNRANYDATNKMGYCHYSGSSPFYAGIKLLSSTPVFCYSIENVTGGSGGVDITDGFVTAEKFTTLSTNKFTAGQVGSGNDVLQVVSSGPFTILPGDSVSVAFAMIGGESLTDLQTSAFNAQQKYNDAFPIGIKEYVDNDMNIYPNPVRGGDVLGLISPDFGDLEILITDSGGKVIIRQSHHAAGKGEKFNVVLTDVSAGIYHVVVNQGNLINTGQLVVLP